jgi:hypothetical protein
VLPGAGEQAGRRLQQGGVEHAADQVREPLRHPCQATALVQWVENRPSVAPRAVRRKPEHHHGEHGTAEWPVCQRSDSTLLIEPPPATRTAAERNLHREQPHHPVEQPARNVAQTCEAPSPGMCNRPVRCSQSAAGSVRVWH